VGQGVGVGSGAESGQREGTRELGNGGGGSAPGRWRGPGEWDASTKDSRTAYNGACSVLAIVPPVSEYPRLSSPVRGL
jgi:hypothetical protein